jgi:fibrillarin-like rRNA methylase
MNIRNTGENFEDHWGFINWKNKQILDIGADFGSTAECFLAVGASKIYASEGDNNLYNQLIEYAKDKPNIVPNKKWISSPADFIDLFNNFKVDIVKMDIEGAEIHLLGVPDDILKSIKEYAIECHSIYIMNAILERFKNLNFDVVDIRRLRPLEDTYNVIYVKQSSK